MSHLTDADLTLLHYSELSDSDARTARAHLESCADCRLQHDRLLRVLTIVGRYPVPEPDAGFEAAVWRRLQPALRAEPGVPSEPIGERLRRWLVPSRNWVVGGALAAAVVIAFLLGRYWQPAQPPPVRPEVIQSRGESSLRERILLSALGDHFDRTQAVLLDLASTGAADTVDISGEQRRAHDLLAATRIYRRAAAEAGDRSVGDVLEALERVLVEVDVSPSQVSAYELSALQRRIQEQELLFKVRVASATVREREHTTRQPTVTGTTGA